MFYDYQTDILRALARRRKKVVHQETCPICGRKLVNLYEHEIRGVWKCKQCWDKEDGISES